MYMGFKYVIWDEFLYGFESMYSFLAFYTFLWFGVKRYII